MSKETLIQELRGYADDSECGLTVRQVENVERQLYRSTVKPVRNTEPETVAAVTKDRTMFLLAALAVVVFMSEIAGMVQ